MQYTVQYTVQYRVQCKVLSGPWAPLPLVPYSSFLLSSVCESERPEGPEPKVNERSLNGPWDPLPLVPYCSSLLHRALYTVQYTIQYTVQYTVHSRVHSAVHNLQPLRAAEREFNNPKPERLLIIKDGST